MRKLDGKVAWISGATSGIGEGIARLFAEQGAKVAIVSEKAALCRRSAAELNRNGCQAIAAPADVSREREVQESIRRTVKAFGRLDIIINNAGIVHLKPLHKSTEREWDHVMAVNVKSMFFSLKHALPHLRKAGRSYMVNLGSISSFVGQAGTPAYTTSKHAIVGLTRSIALDYASSGLRCNCICPGITDTPMLRKHLGAHGDADRALAKRLRRVPLRISLVPADIARAALFLSCDDSQGITGTTLVIDAGYLTAAEWNTEL